MDDLMRSMAEYPSKSGPAKAGVLGENTSDRAGGSFENADEGTSRPKRPSCLAEWQTCPKCGGQGHVSKPPYVAGDIHTWVAGNTSGFRCPVCRGTGLVVKP